MMIHLHLDNVGKPQQKGNAEMERAVDQATSKSLLRAGEVGGDEDIGYVKGDVDAYRSAYRTA